VTLPCSDEDADPITRSILSGPAHGTLAPVDQAAGSVTYTPDPGYAGADSFTFDGADGSGTSNTATASLTVEDAGGAPDTTITKKPKDKTRKKTATFEFSANDSGSTFECSLDGTQFTPCSSPHHVKVKKGKHQFQVRARDAAGNVDGSPASDDWKVKKKKKKKN
jgi:Cadherin-like domain